MQIGTSDHSKDLIMKMQLVQEEILQLLSRQDRVLNEQDLEKLEHEVQALVRRLGDLIVAHKVQHTLDEDEQFQTSASELARRVRKVLVNKGLVSVQIRFAGGTSLCLHVTYWSRKGAAGKRGKGLYPELYLLGIHDHCTPLLASEIAQSAAALCSLKEAQHMMESHGRKLDIKTVRNVTKRFAARAREGRTAEPILAALRAETLKGRKIVLSTDGGRLRIRSAKKGKKTKKSRTRYKTDWREPKLLIIYVVNDNGRIDRKICPIIDGTLGGPDVLFALMHMYLRSIDLAATDQILFVADGAPWIWESVHMAKAMLNLGGMTVKILELIDFYHAAQHLHAFAELKKHWSKKKRKQWVTRQKRLLQSGDAQTVIKTLQVEAKGSKSKLLQRELGYFIKNRHRLSYREVAALKLPIGSGAIESAIRRVVNLRLKSPCIFWKEDSAEEMLLLRAYYKSGRWKLLQKMAYEGGLLYAA